MDVVLLHGALGSAAQLAPLKDILPPSLTPHIVEFEGHGDSEPSDRPFRTQHFAENVLAYMSSTEVERAVLFGYSMGGYVALWLAMNWLSFLAHRIRSSLSMPLVWRLTFSMSRLAYE